MLLVLIGLYDQGLFETSLNNHGWISEQFNNTPRDWHSHWRQLYLFYGDFSYFTLLSHCLTFKTFSHESPIFLTFLKKMSVTLTVGITKKKCLNFRRKNGGARIQGWLNMGGMEYLTKRLQVCVSMYLTKWKEAYPYLKTSNIDLSHTFCKMCHTDLCICYVIIQHWTVQQNKKDNLTWRQESLP